MCSFLSYLNAYLDQSLGTLAKRETPSVLGHADHPPSTEQSHLECMVLIGPSNDLSLHEICIMQSFSPRLPLRSALAYERVGEPSYRVVRSYDCVNVPLKPLNASSQP